MSMDVAEMLATIDAQIARVQDARAKIVALTDEALTSTERGPAVARVEQGGKQKRQLSPEGRARIVEAQRRRHAARQEDASQPQEQEG